MRYLSEPDEDEDEDAGDSGNRDPAEAAEGQRSLPAAATHGAPETKSGPSSAKRKKVLVEEEAVVRADTTAASVARLEVPPTLIAIHTSWGRSVTDKAPCKNTGAKGRRWHRRRGGGAEDEEGEEGQGESGDAAVGELAAPSRPAPAGTCVGTCVMHPPWNHLSLI